MHAQQPDHNSLALMAQADDLRGQLNRAIAEIASLEDQLQAAEPGDKAYLRTTIMLKEGRAAPLRGMLRQAECAASRLSVNSS